MAKIGFIGMGNMGYAMLKGALADFHHQILYFHHQTEKNAKEYHLRQAYDLQKVMQSVAIMPSILCLQ